MSGPSAPRELPLEGGAIDLARLEVRRGDARVGLTAIEAALLAYLAERPGQAIPREELQAKVWGYKEGLVTRAVHHTVTRLRRKIEVDPDAPKHLVSVYGVGYRLELPAPPPPAPARPAPPNAFVGRAAELAELDRHFAAGARLVTLHGCGGMGKTSLARRHLATAPGDGVWCDLVGVSGAARLARIVLDVLGGEAGPDPDAAVVAALRARGRLLLVLDDLDAVADVAGPIVASWLARAPEVRVLATSRRWLGVPEEVCVELAPLVSDDGLALLRARAPGAGEADPGELSALVDALAGLPLAIVLAAPRLALVSPAALRERLATPLALLRSRDGGRHATMRGVLDWSWEQLEPDERDALPALALFDGGFTASAAEAVIGGAGDALDLLDALVRASWIVPPGVWREGVWKEGGAESLTGNPSRRPLDASGAGRAPASVTGLGPAPSAGTQPPVDVAGGCASAGSVREVRPAAERLGMYPVQREYLLERLAERADAAAIGGRHLRWCLGVLEAANKSLEARWSAEVVRRAAAEVSNGLAAFDRELHREPALAAALLVAVWPVATRANPVEEVRLDAAIAALDALPDAAAALPRARLSWLRGLARRVAGRGAAARADLDDALARGIALGDLDLQSLVIGQLGNLAAVEGRLDEAQRHFLAACAINDARGARVAVWLGNLGNVHAQLGDRAAAEARYLEALARLGEAGNPGDRARLHANLGNLQLARGDADAAEDSYGHAETLFRAADERAALAHVTGNRAASRLGLGRHDEALALAIDARTQHRRLGNRRSEAIVTLTLAEIHFEAGRVAEALEHALAGTALLEELRDRVFLAATHALAGTCHHARGALPAALAAWEAAIAGFDGLGNTPSADLARDVADDKAYIKDDVIWTSPVIPVCWENPTSDNVLARLLTQGAVNTTWAKASRVKFVGWGTCTSTSDGIRIRWEDVGPHVEELGDDLDGMVDGMTLNHEFVNWTCSPTNDCISMIAVHEFGHALGFAHEQNRSDTPSSCTDAQQGTDGTVEFGDWDLDSVMNYCNPEWNGDGTLSDGDIEAVQRYYGAPLVQSDFDNDGYEDLVIGVPGEDVGSESNHGAINVLYGTTSGLSVTGDQIWYQDFSTVAGDGEAGDDYGEVLAVGDFDWDGYSDVVVGVPGESVGTVSNAGGINVMYGSASGLSVTGDEIWHSDVAGVPEGAGTGDGFGAAVAVGDFNRDYYMDVAIGSPGEDIGAALQMGVVTVLYGSASGLGTTGADLWHQEITNVEGDGESYDEYGAALATGDLDGDGYDDLVIGVPGEAVGSVADAGAINVLYGSSGGLSVTGDEIWYQGNAGIGDSAATGDRFGEALAVADFDDDGYFDVAVGVPGESPLSTADAGGVHILYGTASGLASLDNALYTLAHIAIIGSPAAGDAFGAALAPGYVDDDQYADLVVGKPGATVGTAAGAGEVMVLLGSSTGLSTTGEVEWNQDSTGITSTAAAGDAFGTAVTTGDYDGDGYADFAAGVPGKTVSTYADAGSVSVIYGSAAGPVSTGNDHWSQGYTNLEGDEEAHDAFGESLR